MSCLHKMIVYNPGSEQVIQNETDKSFYLNCHHEDDFARRKTVHCAE